MPVNLESVEGYSSLEFKAREKVEGFLSGLHRSPFHGFSVEFADYKSYNNGESIKDIDWKLYARTDKLFVKNYEQETNLRCIIALDTSASMCFPFDKKNLSLNNPNKLFYSIFASACIIDMLYKQRDAFGLALISNQVENLTEIKSSYIHKRHIFSLLENLMDKSYKDFTHSTSLAKQIHFLSETIHKRSLVIIFTDLISFDDTDEDFIHSLEHLRHSHQEVIVFNVKDKSLEEELKYKNRPYRFVDVESGETIKLNPSFIREEYSNIIADKINNIHTYCNNVRIDFVECDIEKDYNQVLLPYFYKRTRLY